MLKTLSIIAAFTALMTISAEADEIPQAVKAACEGDYKANCAAHIPGTDEARACMATAFEKLSDPCVEAILNSSLVDEQQRKAIADANAREPEAVPAKRKRTADNARPPSKKRYAAVAKPRKQRLAAQHRTHRPNTVTGYIKRGTSIANFYTSRALARIFR